MQTRFLFWIMFFSPSLTWNIWDLCHWLSLSFVHLEEGGGERGGDVEAGRKTLQTRREAESSRWEPWEAGGAGGAGGAAHQAGDTGRLPSLGLGVQLHQSGNVWPASACSSASSWGADGGVEICHRDLRYSQWGCWSAQVSLALPA